MSFQNKSKNQTKDESCKWNKLKQSIVDSDGKYFSSPKIF